MKSEEKWWARLRDFATSIRVDSVSVGPACLKFPPKQSRTPAFSLITDRLGSREGRRTDAFVLSAHNIDDVTLVDRVDADHECEALGETIHVPGGSGANSAYAIARLNMAVAVAGIVGKDDDGLFLLDSLKEAGVDVSQMIRSADFPTGRTSTFVEQGGQRYIVVHPGINNRYASLADLDALEQSALSSRIVHLSSFVGLEELNLQEELVRRVGSRSLISLAPGDLYARQGLDRLEGLLRHVDVMFLYREQLGMLIGHSSARSLAKGSDTADLLESFYAWRKRNGLRAPVVVVVKSLIRDEKGMVNERFLTAGVGRESLERFIGPQELPKDVRLQAIDTTGAGDAAAAGFLCGMLERAPLESCIDSAFLMAAFAVTQIGARTAFAIRSGSCRLSQAKLSRSESQELPDRLPE